MHSILFATLLQTEYLFLLELAMKAYEGGFLFTLETHERDLGFCPAGLAQWIEDHPKHQEVMGSIPGLSLH